MKSISLGLVVTLLLMITGCSSDSDDGDTPSSVGYLIDSPIAGVTYECDSKSGITDSSGRFECANPPVIFKIGSLIIGTLDGLTLDSKVYPQDLLGLSRSNFTDEDLIALVRLLQSLDDDGIYSDVINIPQATSDKFSNDEKFDPSKLDEYASTAGVDLVGEEEAINHLKANMPEVDSGDFTFEGTGTIQGFESKHLVFDDAFLGESDDSRYYALVCSEQVNVKGQDVAHFDLLERHFTSTTINHLPAKDITISVLDSRLFVEHQNGMILEYVNLADDFSLIFQAALVVIDIHYKGMRDFKTELWFPVGDLSPGSSQHHSPSDANWRDIDSIRDIWHTTRGGENLWMEMRYELVGGSCKDPDIWGEVFDLMQLEVSEQSDHILNQ